jgi:putative endonuclease
MTKTPKQEKGKAGEQLAVVYLKDKGFQIVGENLRQGRAEFDVVAYDKDVLVFVEVKTRNTNFFGNPEEFVTDKKQQTLSLGAAKYIEKNDFHGEIRFDIVAVVLDKTHPEIVHFEDAFWIRE